jgi:hypothetical protein
VIRSLSLSSSKRIAGPISGRSLVDLQMKSAVPLELRVPQDLSVSAFHKLKFSIAK